MSADALLFGAGGALGSVIRATLEERGFQVFTAGASAGVVPDRHIQLPYDRAPDKGVFAALPPLDAVVWAQGLNSSDAITAFELSDLKRLLQGNVVFVASSLAALFKAGKLLSGSRLAVVSSIWQLESRPGKFSYTVSKSALRGLVKSCAIDLGAHGILINAVLPGVVDTPMTRAHLSTQQIAAITAQSALHRLADPIDIAEAVAFLVSGSNRAITGQFLTVDAGFTGFKHA